MKKSHNNIKKAVLEELKNDSKDMSFSNVTMLSDSSFMSTGSVKSKKILHKTN